MELAKRIQLCLMLESIEVYENFSKRAGIMNCSIYEGNEVYRDLDHNNASTERSMV